MIYLMQWHGCIVWFTSNSVQVHFGLASKKWKIDGRSPGEENNVQLKRNIVQGKSVRCNDLLHYFACKMAPEGQVKFAAYQTITDHSRIPQHFMASRRGEYIKCFSIKGDTVYSLVLRVLCTFYDECSWFWGVKWISWWQVNKKTTKKTNTKINKKTKKTKGCENSWALCEWNDMSGSSSLFLCSTVSTRSLNARLDLDF